MSDRTNFTHTLTRTDLYLTLTMTNPHPLSSTFFSNPHSNPYSDINLVGTAHTKTGPSVVGRGIKTPVRGTLIMSQSQSPSRRNSSTSDQVRDRVRVSVRIL